jgi:hypothetical protein
MNGMSYSDAVAWWRMGRTAKAEGHDIARWARNIKYVAARKLFLAGAAGEPKPTMARKPVQTVEKE